MHAARSTTVLATGSERAGEGIFKGENCGRCHTLFDRPREDGRIDLPSGPSVDLLDSRVGPDLGLEGHRRSDEWHYAHLYAPGVLVPGSRMPPSRHLFRPEAGRPGPTREAIDLVAYLQALGRAQRDIWAEWRRRDPDVPAPPRADAALAGRGDELYRRDCAACHGVEGDGRGDLAGFFSFPPRDFVAGHYRFKSTPFGRPPADADLYRTITLGTGTGAAMPAFYWLGETDRWALVLKVKEFSAGLRGMDLHGEEPPVSTGRSRPEAEVISYGRRLWDSLGCVSCHGPSGAGMSREQAHADWQDAGGAAVPRSGDLTHACALRGGASPAALTRAILLGVEPVMPSYSEALSERDALGELIAYVESLDTTGPKRSTGSRERTVAYGTPPVALARRGECASTSRRTPGRP